MREPQSIWQHFNAPRPYTRTIELERSIGGFQCQFEVSVKLWPEHEQFPEIDCVSEIEAFNDGGQQCTNRATINTLETLVQTYCKEHLDEIVNDIEYGKDKE